MILRSHAGAPHETQHGMNNRISWLIFRAQLFVLQATRLRSCPQNGPALSGRRPFVALGIRTPIPPRGVPLRPSQDSPVSPEARRPPRGRRALRPPVWLWPRGFLLSAAGPADAGDEAQRTSAHRSGGGSVAARFPVAPGLRLRRGARTCAAAGSSGHPRRSGRPTGRARRSPPSEHRDGRLHLVPSASPRPPQMVGRRGV